MKEKRKLLLATTILIGVLLGGGLNLTLATHANANIGCGTCVEMDYSPGSFCDIVNKAQGGGCDAHHTGAPCTQNCGIQE